jgi:hypothetical protein
MKLINKILYNEIIENTLPLYNNELYNFSEVFTIANIEILLSLDRFLNQELKTNL